jgi:hypothetical protein
MHIQRDEPNMPTPASSALPAVNAPLRSVVESWRARWAAEDKAGAHLGVAAAMSAAVEMITPSAAKAMLANNTGNRKPSLGAVAQMAADMKTGHWRLTHQGIALAPDGRLLDGQHRLMAVVEAGASLPMMVFRNVDPAAFSAIDRGRVRSLRDVLGIDGRLLEPCNFIARLHGITNVQAHHAQAVLDGCGMAVLELVTKAGSVARGRTAAPIKAAAALRLMQGHGAYAIQQWCALVNLQFGDMTPAIQALLRQITDEARVRGSGGSSVQYDRAVRAWMAFDPARANVSKIQVKDIDRHLNEMRGVWAPPWTG